MLACIKKVDVVACATFKALKIKATYEDLDGVIVSYLCTGAGNMGELGHLLLTNLAKLESKLLKRVLA